MGGMSLAPVWQDAIFRRTEFLANDPRGDRAASVLAAPPSYAMVPRFSGDSTRRLRSAAANSIIEHPQPRPDRNERAQADGK